LGLIEDLRMLPAILRLTGLPRLSRGAAMAAAMEHAHPEGPFFYLAFIGVVPRMQGAGIGSALLRQTLLRTDAAGASAYLENSNPRNLKLYERAGFCVLREIKARTDAPPVYAMWRPARKRE
jgi:ribosomal protein S18 acetylase RimI-like enzyme